MLKIEQLHLLLRVNGLSAESTDEEIRSVLISASFNETDIEQALFFLRNDSVKTSNLEGLNKIFRTSTTLDSAEISKLLGIEVELNDESVQKQKASSESLMQDFVVIFLACIIALSGVLLVMFIYEVGIFYTPKY